ncbi:MAG: hypothetical protein CME70_08560 [Halobacteriovorax sp.]|nr:hypothetical protein [Halobacteriovorax sp.]
MDPVTSYYEIGALVFCLFASGFFSGSEAVLMSIGVDRAKQLIEEDGSRGKAFKFMVEKPNELLATILVGNNVVNILAASLNTAMASRYFEDDAISISVGVTTIAILIFGEIIPKTFARTHAETLSYPIIKILQFCYILTYPIIHTMVWIIETVLGKNAQISGRMITQNDFEYMLDKAEKENTMDAKQIDMLNNILEFPTIKVKDIMIPRLEIKFIRADWNFHKVIDAVEQAAHSRYPVCEGELDNTIGFLHIKDLAFVRGEMKGKFDLKKILKDPFFVYEHMKISAVFDHMNRKKVHLAMVKDETGMIVGIITLEDIIEEILGEIQDEHDEEIAEVLEEYQEADLEEGIFVDGTISLRELYNDYDIKIPLNDNYSTLAGFILDMLGNNFPEGGQIIVWEGFSFELSKVEDYEIRQIRIRDVDGEKHLFSKKEANEADEETIDVESPVES